MPINLPELRPDVVKRLADVCAHPSKFISLLSIHHKYEHKLVPFEMNDEQSRLLEVLAEYNRIIILKPRQIGISTLLRSWAFYKAWTSPEAVRYGVLSHHQRSARHLQRMDKVFYANLPRMMQRRLEQDNTTTIQFGDSGAELSSFTASSKHGTRSFTLTSAHLSEFAFYIDPAETLATVSATVGDGQIIIETTPNAPGDLFHRLCEGAQDGTNGWKLVTFWWWEHQMYRSPLPREFERTEDEESLAKKYDLDDEQIYWRRQQVNTLGESKFRREYPGCLDDAFHNTGANYIPGELFDEIEMIDFDGPEMVYEEPDYDDLYSMGVDVGGGVGQDYSAITVVSATTLQPVYQWRNNVISPAAFADHVATMYSKYHKPRVLCESNNHGHLCLYRLRELGVRNLWVNQDGHDWYTSTRTKLEAFEVLREYIVGGLLRALGAVPLMELKGLIIKKVCPEAPKGLNDDLAMSMALAYRCLRDLPRRQVIGFTRTRMEKRLTQMRANRIRAQVIPWKISEG